MDANAIFVYALNKQYLLNNLVGLLLIFSFGILFFIFNKYHYKMKLSIFWLLMIYHTVFSIYWYKIGVADSIGYYNAAAAYKMKFTIFGGFDVFFMWALFYPLIQLFKFTFFTTTMLFNMIGFYGLIFLYLALYDYLKLEKENTKYLNYLIFLPSFTVWTGFAGKDALIFFSLGLFLYSLVNIKNKFLLAAFALLIMIHVRPYIFLIAAVALLLGITFSKNVNAVLKGFLVLIAVALLVVGIKFVKSEQKIDVTNLNQASQFIVGQQGRWGGGSDVDISNYNIVFKIITFLYRPLFFDARSLIMVLSSFENLILLIFSLCFLKPNFYKQIFSQKTLFIKFNFFFFMIATVALAYANANLGTIARKKIMVLISMLSLVIFYYSQKAAGQEKLATRAPKFISLKNATGSVQINSIRAK
jgi:hypothetical protein